MLSSAPIGFYEISKTVVGPLEEPYLLGVANLTLELSGTIAALPAHTIAGNALLSVTAAGQVVSVERVVTGTALLETVVTCSVQSPNTLRGNALLSLEVSGTFGQGVSLTGRGLVSLLASGEVATVNRINGALGISLTLSGHISPEAMIQAVASISLDVAAYIKTIVPVASTAITAYVVNTTTLGHAVYTGYNFNGYMRIGKDYFATSDNGLFKLTGDVAAPWSAKGALSDCGSDKIKMVSEVFVDLRATGDVSLKLEDGEVNVRQGYRIAEDGNLGLHKRRVKTGLGRKGNYWKVSLSGETAAEVKSVALRVHPTTRNI